MRIYASPPTGIEPAMPAWPKAMQDVVTGRIDLSGNLVSADEMLIHLQEQAGSLLGEPFAVPSLASVVRLSRSLGAAISRNVICASGDHDLEMAVRASPDESGVDLAIDGWSIHPQRRPWLTEDFAETNPIKTSSSWNWETDEDLKIVATYEFSGPDIIGQRLTQVFRMLENSDNSMPILDASATGGEFSDQPAVMRSRPDQEVVLSGRVVRDDRGVFAGIEGCTKLQRPNSPGETDTSAVGAAFTDKLDSALRVPLSRIVANADNISAQTDGPLRRDYADYAGDIASAARHLLTLVDDLSDMQTLDSADFRVELDDIDLAQLGRQAAGLLKVRGADRKIRIDSPGMTDTLPAKGDYRRVMQILVNLIGNAIRYSPDEGMIWIRIEKDDDTAVLIVADQGSGIASTDHERIFNKFERVDPSEPGGSGLGLYISRRLAQAMSGDIVVDSAPGQGARFVLTLPAV
jgi:signal transduction histidine kinase